MGDLTPLYEMGDLTPLYVNFGVRMGVGRPDPTLRLTLLCACYFALTLLCATLRASRVLVEHIDDLREGFRAARQRHRCGLAEWRYSAYS